MDDTPKITSLTPAELEEAKRIGFDIEKYYPEPTLSRRGYREITDDDRAITWGDYGRAVASGAAGVASGLGAAAEYASNGRVGGATRRYFDEAAENQREQMGPAARRAMGAAFLPDEGETSVLENATASLGLKSVSALPSLVSAIIPGGLAAGVTRGVLSTAARAALAGGVSRGAAGVMNAGDIAGEIYSGIEKLSDDELRRSPVYVGYRSMMSEQDARRQFMNDVAGAAPVLAFAITSLTGGLEGQIGRRLGGEAAKGVVRGGIKGATGEAVQESLESGGGELLRQLQMIQYSLMDEANYQKILSQTIEGGVLGGVLGGVGGAATNIGGAPRQAPSANPRDIKIDPAQEMAIQFGSAPPEPQNEQAIDLGAPIGERARANMGGREVAERIRRGQETRQDYEYYQGLRENIRQQQERGMGDVAREALQKSPVPEYEELSGPNEAARIARENMTDAERRDREAERFQQVRGQMGRAVRERIAARAPDVTQPKGVGTGVAAQPAESPNVGNPQSAPTRSEVEYPKAAEAAPAAPSINVGEVAPDIGEALSRAEGRTPFPPAPPASDNLGELNRQPAAPPPGIQQNIDNTRQPRGPAPQTPRLSEQVNEAAADDTGRNIPEINETLSLQQQALREGRVKAQMFPLNSKPLPLPKGMKAITTPRGVFHFNPKLTNEQEVKALSKAKRENELLSLGPLNKDDVARSGEPQQAVVERQNGTEVSAAVTVPSAAKQTIEAIKQRALPGSTVGVEPVAKVLNDRVTEQGKPRVLRPAGEEDFKPISELQETDLDAKERAKIGKPLKEETAKAPAGKKRTPAEIEARQRLNAQAEELMKAFPPSERPEGYKGRGQAAVAKRNEILALAQRVLDAAKAAGIEIPATNRGNIDESMNLNAAVLRLMEARDLGKKAASQKGPQAADFERFVGRNYLLAKGGKEARDIVSEERKYEGDAVKKKAATTEDVDRTDGAGADLWQREEANPEKRIEDRQEDQEANADALEGEDQRDNAEVRERESVIEKRIGERLQKPDERIAKVKALAKSTTSEGERKAADAAAERIENNAPSREELEQAVLQEFVTAGGDRQGMFKVERKRRIVVPKGPIAARMGDVGSWADVYVQGQPGRSVVYEDDKVALIRARAVNGKSIYVPAHTRLGMAFVDIDSFTNRGNQFTAEQIAKLKQVKQEILAAEAAARPANAVEAMNGQWVTPLRSFNLEDALRRVDWSQFGPLFGVLRDRIIQEVRGTPAHIVDPADMLAVTGASNTLGFYEYNSKIGERIYIRSDLDEVRGAETLVHEAGHALVMRVMRADQKSYERVRDVMIAVRDHYAARGVDVYEQAGVSQYAYNSMDEFVAEAMGNPRFQKMLAETPLDAALAQRLGVAEWRGKTLWRAIVEVFAQIVRLPNGAVSALEAIMKTVDEAANKRAALNPAGASVSAAKVADWVPDGDSAINAKGMIRRGLDRVKMTGQIAREMTDGLFKGTDAPLRAYQLRRAIDTRRNDLVERLGGEKLIADHAELQRANPEAYEQMVNAGYRLTMLGANPGSEAANPHFGKNKRRYWQAREQLADATAEFNALDKPYRDLLLRSSDVFKDIQNRASLQELKNILEKIGVNEPGLAERIHADGLTEADKALVESNAALAAIEEAQAFKKIQGLYLPAMRRGTHVVGGRFKLEPPKTAVMQEGENDTLIFTGDGNYEQAEADAKAYLANARLDQLAVTTVYVDPKNPSAPLEKEDVDSRRAVRVRMQTQFTEFVDSEAAALDLEQQMRAKGLQNVFAEPREQTLYRTKNVYAPDMERIEKSLQKDDKFRTLDEDGKSAVLQALREAGLRFSGDNSLAHRRLYRQKVAGFSTDLVRNVQEYLGAAASYLGRLELQPKVDAAFKEMREWLETRRYDGAQNAIRRREQYELLKQRIYAPDESGQRNAVVSRLLQVTMINKLAGVSWHVVNAHEPWTTGASYLAGRHRPAAVFNQLRRTYRMIGAGSGVVSGLRDTIKAFSQDTGFTNFQDFFVKSMQQNGASNERVGRINDMLGMLHEYGLFDREAGMEATRVNDPSQNMVLRGFDRAELMVRQMGQTMEAINRAVVSISAYELEFERTGNHEAAKRYAFETIHDTMGDYSNTNAAPVFKGNLGALALQFKKFGQKQIWLTARAFIGMTRGDKEAARQFAGYMLTTAVVAGVLGLPGLELIKIPMMALGAMGAGFDYDDFEDLVRSTTAGVLGAAGGEIVSKGAYRALNMDMSGRLGQDSLLTFGQPRSAKTNDLKAWLFDTVAGAPAGTVLSQIESVQKAISGDALGAAEKSILPKFAIDILKAYRGATDGKMTESGRQTLTPYTAGETAMRSIGITPAREAEQGRMRARSNEQARGLEDQRRKFTTDWIKATPAERARMWGKVEQWNKGKPADARLARADLDRAVKRRASEESRTVNTVVTNKRSRYIAEQNSGIYNLRQ